MASVSYCNPRSSYPVRSDQRLTRRQSHPACCPRSRRPRSDSPYRLAPRASALASTTHSHRERGIASQNTDANPSDPRRVARREAADVVADLKRMEAIRAVADERRIIVVPGLGPVAAEQVAERFAKLIGNNQADAGDEQHMLPAPPWPPCPAYEQDHEHERRPALHERRRFGQPRNSSKLAMR